METAYLKNNNRIIGNKVIVLGEDTPEILKQAIRTHRDTEIVIRAMIDGGSLWDVMSAVLSCAMKDKSPAIDLLSQAAEIELMK